MVTLFSFYRRNLSNQISESLISVSTSSERYVTIKSILATKSSQLWLQYPRIKVRCKLVPRLCVNLLIHITRFPDSPYKYYVTTLDKAKFFYLPQICWLNPFIYIKVQVQNLCVPKNTFQHLPNTEPVPLCKSKIQEVVDFDVSKYRRMDEYITPKANWAPFPSKNIRKVAIRTIQDHPLSTSLHHFDGLFCFLKLSKSSSMRGSPSNRSIGNSSFSPGAMLPDRSLCAGPISRFTIHATTDCFSFKCDYKAVLLTADLQSHYFASSLFNTRLVLQVSNRR